MFPVETISAKMLDYYVGRRDTLDHRSERKRVLYAQSCKRSRKHAIWRNRRIYSLSKRENTGSVLRQGRGKPSACKAACKAWVLYQVCYRRFWSISGKKSCNFAISMIRCKRKKYEPVYLQVISEINLSAYLLCQQVDFSNNLASKFLISALSSVAVATATPPSSALK